MKIKITKRQVFTALLIIVIGTALLAHLYQVSEKFRRVTLHQLYLERQDHALDLISKNVQLTSVMYESAWNQVDGLTIIADRDGVLSCNSMAAATQYMKSYCTIDNCNVVMIDKFGTYYTSNGYVGVWNDDEKQLFMNSERNAFITLDEDTGTEYMIFLEKLSQDFFVQNVCVRYIGIAVDTHGYEDVTLSDGVSDGRYVYIVDDNGQLVFRNATMESLYDSNDILTAFKYVSYTNNATHEAFQADFEAHRTASYEVFICGVDYFISQARIPNTNWTMITFTPTAVLGSDTYDLIEHTNWYLRVITIFFVAITLVSVLMALLISRLNRRNRNEKENAIRMMLLNEKLELANQKADEASITKKEFLARMSHDMRTPINGIIGMTAMAQAHMDDQEKMTHYLEEIDHSSQQLMNLVEDVLSLNRLADHDIVIVSKEITLGEVCDECVEFIEESIGDKKIRFVQDITCDEDRVVYTDIEAIKQVLSNIVSNAVKFSPKNGTITFRAYEVEREKENITIRFSVEDNGKGMKKEFLPHLFETFSQEHDAGQTSYEGTGLGMAISKGYVDMLGGAIIVESKEGKGSKFHIEIPMQMKAAEFSYDLNKKRKRTISGMRILLVEDNELNMEIAQEILESQGVIIETAVNGQEAIAKFSDSELDHFDAILMDIMMPVLDGYAATRAIRRMDREDAKNIPIIAMTANAYDEDVRKSVEAGMNSHVAKPIVVDILIKTLLAYRID